MTLRAADERSAQVGELEVHALAPQHFVGPRESEVGRLGEARVVVGVATEHPVQIAGLLQAFAREGLQRLPVVEDDNGIVSIAKRVGQPGHH